MSLSMKLLLGHEVDSTATLHIQGTENHFWSKSFQLISPIWLLQYIEAQLLNHRPNSLIELLTEEKQNKN